MSETHPGLISIITVVILCLFWTIGRFATVEGNSDAANFISCVQDLNAPTVTVISKNDLRLPISAYTQPDSATEVRSVSNTRALSYLSGLAEILPHTTRVDL